MLSAFCAFAVAAGAVMLVLAGWGGGEKTGSAPVATHSVPARSPASSSASASRTVPHAHSRPGRELRRRRYPAPPWQPAATAVARTFVTWFDRWLAGESTARQAPDATASFAAELRASDNTVPPAARGHVGAITQLVVAGMPPRATDPHEAWIYAATRSQGVIVRFTVEERFQAGRWLVYAVYQGT